MHYFLPEIGQAFFLHILPFFMILKDVVDALPENFNKGIYSACEL